jgi:hypothetical protein
MTELRSSWAFGSYRKGMGGPDAHYRESFATLAIKRELAALGATGLKLDSSYLGAAADRAIRDFQAREGLTVDGAVGRQTANALFRAHLLDAEDVNGIPRHWLRAHCHWESGDDPGAELVNPDASRDRGLFQNNDQHESDPLSDAEAFDPAVSIPRRARGIAAWAAAHPRASCRIDDAGTVRKFYRFAIGVSAHRTPVGAQDLADDPDVVEPKRQQDGGSWEEAAAYYILRVDHEGRVGWVG